MISQLSSYRSAASQRDFRLGTSPTFTSAHLSRINANRAARDLLFERTHGSLWEHGLLDRLSSPLTRFRE